MNHKPQTIETPPAGLGLHDVLFVVCRHKWKILTTTLLGLIGAAFYTAYQPSVYESQAKLLVRYVVDTSSIDSFDPQGRTSTTSNDAVINTEIEILGSWDLALKVADAVGIEKLIPATKKNRTRLEAARIVAAGLKVGSNRGSKVIWVSFESADANLSSVVLAEVVKQYLEMHLEVHRPSGGFEYLTQQSDQMRLRLNQTEEQLKKLKIDAGIISLDDSMQALASRVEKGQEELESAQTELAASKARLADLQKSYAAQPATTKVAEEPAPIPNDVVRSYRNMLAQLDKLESVKLELATKYASESRQVRVNEQLTAALKQQRMKLEREYPALNAVAEATQSGSSTPTFDLAAEKSRVAALEARVEALRKQVEENHNSFGKFSDVAMQITQLQRRKQLEEENAKYFDASLEKARIDETLNPSKMPNINVVQKPSPGEKRILKNSKTATGIALGGLILGVALAALKELVIDKTIKRAEDLERRLHVSLTMAIPRVGDKKRRSAALTDGDLAVRPHVAPWEEGHFIRTYCDAIRDRLELYFQVMTHKPKLLAVAGLSEGSGTSTLAAGLAAALSQTADGKVLFVDMNGCQTNLHPFMEGRPALPLADAFQVDRPIESAAENLYLATASTVADERNKPMLKRFYDLIPLMKGSDFDYIVFDLPPFTPTSPSLGLAGFMDRTVLVVEAEKDRQETLQRVYGDLVERRSNVSVVLNKVESFLPNWAA